MAGVFTRKWFRASPLREQGLVAYLIILVLWIGPKRKSGRGDADETLSQVYQRLVDKVSARHEVENHAVAQHSDVIARGDNMNARLVYVEQALELLLAPIAEKSCFIAGAGWHEPSGFR